MRRENSVLFIGASAGGVMALKNLFGHFKSPLPVPVVVVLHLPPDASVEPRLAFGYSLTGKFEDVIDKALLQPGYFYFAPAGYHLLVEKTRSLALSQDEMVNFSRPSIDVTFESAARALGEDVIGALLTGANADGAQGLRSIHERGGLTVVQDPKDAEVATMPAAALELCKPDFTGNLTGIAKYLAHILRGQNNE